MPFRVYVQFFLIDLLPDKLIRPARPASLRARAAILAADCFIDFATDFIARLLYLAKVTIKQQILHRSAGRTELAVR